MAIKVPKKKRKQQKANLIKAYKNAVKKGHMKESEAKKGISELTKDFKQYGV